MLYRQYLENIRLSISNYDLPELKSKEYLMILQRVKDIEDLSYIDVILKNAGLDLSFMGDKSFLSTPIKLTSKLDKLFEEDSEVDNDMQEALSEYLTGFISKEDDVLSKIDNILGEKGISAISSEYFPQSESPILDSSSLLEHHKETLSSLFKGLSSLSSKAEEKVSEKEPVEEEFIEDSEIEGFDDLGETEEFVEEIEEPEEIEEIVEIVEKEEKEEPKKSFKLDTSFLDEDVVKEPEISDVESSDEDSYWSEERDFTMFLDSDEENDTKSNAEEPDFEDIEEEISKPVKRYKGITQKELDDEVNKLYPEEEYTTDPLINQFEDATNYFLTGKHKDKSDLSELYKRKEKIVDMEEVSTVDDSLAKIILAMGDGVLKMPNMTVNLFKKLKENSKKIKENMIVGDEENEEED